MRLGNVILWGALVFAFASITVAEDSSETNPEPKDPEEGSESENHRAEGEHTTIPPHPEEPVTQPPPPAEVEKEERPEEHAATPPPPEEPVKEEIPPEHVTIPPPPNEPAKEEHPPEDEPKPSDHAPETSPPEQPAPTAPPVPEVINEVTTESPKPEESLPKETPPVTVAPPTQPPAVTQAPSSHPPPETEAHSDPPPVPEAPFPQPPPVTQEPSPHPQPPENPPNPPQTPESSPDVNTETNQEKIEPPPPQASDDPNRPEWERSPYLPATVLPTHYDIYLFPDLAEGVFEGKVGIMLTITEPRDYILVHIKQLNITSTKLAKVVNQMAECISIKNTTTYEPHHFLVIIPEEKLNPGKYSVIIKFTGDMKGKMNGLYRSSYTDRIGLKRYLATTKFEPTYAREAFPCLDEPEMKATFAVNLVRPSEDYFTLSNMQKVSERVDYPGLGLTTDKFATTPRMSTYLACFIVCDFEKLPTIKSETGIPVTAYARRGLEDNMKFALDLSAKSIDYYTSYFKIKYALPKYDIIGIPDFPSGAMENWGLVTFRETSVIISENVSTVGNYESVSGTVCHEAAHMWFGNLATMKWWDDLWLNEGFATFLQSKCIDHVHPTWDITGIQTVRSTHGVLVEDAALTSHPIIKNVSNPDQINEMFDTISYVKGSAILRMLESISPENFRAGVSKYLVKHKFNNANTLALWEAIQEEMKEVNIVRLMGTWTKQMGFPLVKAIRQGNEVVISQQRYLADVDLTYENDTEYNYKWDIPLTYFTSEDPKKIESIILNLDSESVIVTLPPNTSWFKLNSRQKGFYRVNYLDEDWKNFENVLRHDPSAIGSLDKANLIDDVFNLAKSGYITYSIPLSFATYFQSKESEFLPWLSLSSNLNSLNKKLRSAEFYEDFQAYAKHIVATVDCPHMWEINDSDETLVNKWKGLWISTACKFGLESCLRKAREIFKQWTEDRGREPNPNIRTAVMKAAISGEDEMKNWDRIWKMFVEEEDPQEQLKLRAALASVENVEIVKKLLELIKDENLVRSQDYVRCLIDISRTRTGNAVVWEFTRENWDYLVKRFTISDRGLGRLLPAVVSSFDSEEKLKEVKDFIEANPEAGAGASGRKKALASIENNIKWKERNFNQIRDWLNEWKASKS